jgi:predicted nucleotidyltransferase
MIPLVGDNLDAIADLCRTHGIQSLDVFGSAAVQVRDADANDIDLICDLGTYEPEVADRLFAFAHALEELFGKPVDLLTVPMIRNPYFRQAIDEQRVRLYEARDRQAAA